jgi:hypothetical protein
MARVWIAGLSLQRFQVKWAPVRVKKTRQHKDLKFGSNLFRTGLQGRKLQNFSPRSYWFAGSMPVFHPLYQPLNVSPGPAGTTGVTPKHGWRRSGRLTCRGGAPKTRDQSKPISAETRYSRESFDG